MKRYVTPGRCIFLPLVLAVVLGCSAETSSDLTISLAETDDSINEFVLSTLDIQVFELMLPKDLPADSTMQLYCDQARPPGYGDASSA